MAIKLNCPHCKTPLQVPTKLMGQYTQCPACQSRMLIPMQSPDVSLSGSSVSAASSGVGAASSGVGVPTPLPPGEVGRGDPQASAAPYSSAATSQTPLPPGEAGRGSPQTIPAGKGAISDAIARFHSSPTAPAAVWSDHAPAEPAPQRKIARFITADSAPSTITLAPNGELPKLQLAEGANTKRAGEKGPGMNPLVLVGAACFSFCMCIVILLMDVDGTVVDTYEEARIRQKLESYYKNQEGQLSPYQSMLREAQQARSRGDRRTEQRLYRKVLDLIHAERRDPHDRFRGLTGTPNSDRDLENQLAKLLAGSSAESAGEE